MMWKMVGLVMKEGLDLFICGLGVGDRGEQYGMNGVRYGGREIYLEYK